MALYSDINTYKKENFPLVTDLDSVIQSISNFFDTKKGQRLFRPLLGNDLDKDLLFELAEEDAVLLAITRLTEGLEFWDPRVSVDSSTTVEVFPDTQQVSVNLVFKVNGFGDQTFSKNFTV